jgi:hypothetical protein
MIAIEDQSPQRPREDQQEDIHPRRAVPIQITPDALELVEEADETEVEQIELEIGGDEIQLPSSSEPDMIFFTGNSSWERFRRNIEGVTETQKDTDEYPTFLNQNMTVLSEEEMFLDFESPRSDDTEDSYEEEQELYLLPSTFSSPPL